MDAYEKGLKGCTTYRPSDVRGSVLSIDDAPAPAEQAALPLAAPASHPERYEKDGVVYMSKPLERETVLPGFTYKLQWPESDHAIYITINDILQDGRRRPSRFSSTRRTWNITPDGGADTHDLRRLRRGGDVTFVVEELKAVRSARRHMDERPLCAELLAAIGG